MKREESQRGLVVTAVGGSPRFLQEVEWRKLGMRGFLGGGRGHGGGYETPQRRVGTGAFLAAWKFPAPVGRRFALGQPYLCFHSGFLRGAGPPGWWDRRKPRSSHQVRGQTAEAQSPSTRSPCVSSVVLMLIRLMPSHPPPPSPNPLTALSTNPHLLNNGSERLTVDYISSEKAKFNTDHTSSIHSSPPPLCDGNPRP